MKDSRSSAPIIRALKELNEKMIEANPAASFVSREYRYANSLTDFVLPDMAGFKMKFESKDLPFQYFTSVKPKDDHFELQLIRTSLN